MSDVRQSPPSVARAGSIDQGLRRYMLRVYNLMCLGLAFTGLSAWFGASSGIYLAIAQTPFIWLLMFSPLIMVFILSARLHKLSNTAARLNFWAFSALMGLSLSYVFLAYTGESVVTTLLITSIAFGSLSIYGYTTKKDLSAWGSFLFMAVIGLIIAMIVNIFMQSSAMHFAISVIGVLVFAGLTAYDTQKIRQEYYQLQGTDMAEKGAIMGALRLYLDFINMFIFLLQFLGNRE